MLLLMKVLSNVRFAVSWWRIWSLKQYSFFMYLMSIYREFGGYKLGFVLVRFKYELKVMNFCFFRVYDIF